MRLAHTCCQTAKWDVSEANGPFVYERRQAEAINKWALEWIMLMLAMETKVGGWAQEAGDAVRGRVGLLSEWRTMGIRLTEECPEVFTTKDCWALAQLMSRKPLGQWVNEEVTNMQTRYRKAVVGCPGLTDGEAALPRCSVCLLYPGKHGGGAVTAHSWTRGRVIIHSWRRRLV